MHDRSASPLFADPSLLPLTAAIDRNGQLWLAGHNTATLVEEFGTPLYLYDGATFKQRLAEIRAALVRNYPGPARVAYAAKAGFSPGLARRLREGGIGLEVVSGGEMAVAREAGFEPAVVHLHGNNKSLAERGERIDIWLRLTPSLDVDTHPYRKTGHAASKFGMHMVGANSPASEALERASASLWLNPTGLHTHLGSEIYGLAPYATALNRLLDFAAARGFVPAELSPGGGLAVPYTAEDPVPDVDEWVAAMSGAVIDGCRARDWPLPLLVVEPGRWLIGPAAVALYRVGTRKTAADGTRYVAVDGGLADNPRPALYGARYTAFLANRAREEAGQAVTVVGRFCESSDILVHNVRLPEPQPGDLLAVPVSGAYHLSMASRYNLPPEPVALWLEDGIVERI
jgi:diaminopimelate decarboxylase